jgi:subtilisin family serine protease
LKRGLVLLAACGAAAVLGGASARPRPPGGARVEVVVALSRPALGATRSPRAAARLAADQAALERRIEAAIPSAYVRWRYRYVLDALAVVVPERDVDRLAAVPGVATVYPNVRYGPQLTTTPGLIGAPQLWGPSLQAAGQGIKIGIIDDGVQQTHPFFNPAGYSYPPGFPKGQRAYTTPKVIVARAFPPPSPKWRYASVPFDPQFSDHATHVAGIAAGNHGTAAPGAPDGLSGIAPKAYIGNYKVLTIPTPLVGLDGNAAEIAAGIEAAVHDGMTVINLSLGEPEVEPSRDVVVAAIDGAAAAGVVPVVAAGNDFGDLGFGTVTSPGNAPGAITVAATTKSGFIADFSSAGPTPISLHLKPDVSAPGVDVYSSVPKGWDSFSGTSMAAPHVAGGAALLLQRHPGWTVAQVKSALELTGTPVENQGGHGEAPPAREGGGQIFLPAANDPRIFASPSGLSFGLVRRGRVYARTVRLTDAGGGAGSWLVRIVRHGGAGVKVAANSNAVTVPGTVTVRVAPGSRARVGDVSGFVVLSQPGIRRRVPFWGHVEVPQLRRERHLVLRRTGVYHGDTRGRPARVDRYLFPTDPVGLGIDSILNGPEQVFRVVLRRPVANFGVVLLAQGRGVHVTPRVVRADDENRLTGYAGLPLDLNPYRTTLDRPVPVAGAVLPTAGSYDVVFDTPSRASAGSFTFRFWVGDTQPPRVRLLTRSVAPRSPLLLAITDAGSGVDPGSLSVAVDDASPGVRYSARTGLARVSLGPLRPGTHRLAVSVSDFQEAKNMEDVARILPNTRVFRTTFRIRR